MKQYYLLLCLLLAACVAGAQQKEPDMSRFVSNGVFASKQPAMTAKNTVVNNTLSEVPDMSLFSKAPILKGGSGGVKAAARAAAGNADIPSNHAPEKKEIPKPVRAIPEAVLLQKAEAPAAKP